MKSKYALSVHSHLTLDEEKNSKMRTKVKSEGKNSVCMCLFGTQCTTKKLTITVANGYS